MEYQEAGYRKWEKEANKHARTHAKKWLDDINKDGFDKISYDSNMFDFEERYILTKVQIILFHCGLMVKYRIEKSPHPDWLLRITVYLFVKEPGCYLDDLDGEESASESESEEDPQATC